MNTMFRRSSPFIYQSIANQRFRGAAHFSGSASASSPLRSTGGSGYGAGGEEGSFLRSVSSGVAIAGFSLVFSYRFSGSSSSSSSPNVNSFLSLADYPRDSAKALGPNQIDQLHADPLRKRVFFNHEKRPPDDRVPQKRLWVLGMWPTTKIRTTASRRMCTQRRGTAIWRSCRDWRLVECEGCSLSEPDRQGNFPLHWAALNNETAAAQYIIEHGGDVNAADHTGQTALHWSAVRGSIQVAELLLQEGAQITAADANGYQSTHIAAQKGQTTFLHHLVSKWNADPDVPDKDGRSPLHWAAYNGFADCIRLLLFLDAYRGHVKTVKVALLSIGLLLGVT